MKYIIRKYRPIIIALALLVIMSLVVLVRSCGLPADERTVGLLQDTLRINTHHIDSIAGRLSLLQEQADSLEKRIAARQVRIVRLEKRITEQKVEPITDVVQARKVILDEISRPLK